MKKALLLIAGVAMAASVYADGTITFSNRNVPTASGTGGGNGNGTYNIPIWAFGGTGTDGAGDLAGGVIVGVFRDLAATTPLLNTSGQPGTALLRTDANSQFFGTPSSQTLNVPGVEPGTSQTLVVRAWQGTGQTFAQAKGSGTSQYGEWEFTTRPLGGTPSGGGLPITPPNMTGWGNENGAGVTLVPEPSVMALGALGIGAMLLRRRK